MIKGCTLLLLNIEEKMKIWKLNSRMHKKGSYKLMKQSNSKDRSLIFMLDFMR